MADDLQDISKLKVADLKRELKARGLSVAGNKNELVERLQLSLQGENSLITEPDSAVGDPEEILDEDDVLADEEEEEEALVDDITSPELKRKLSEEEEETPSATNKRIGTKKIVLNRSVVAVSTPSSEKENHQMTSDSDTGQKPETPTSDKKVVKLSAYSVKERLELRAQKFGVELSLDAKKEARAARFGTSDPMNTTTVSSELLRKRAERFGLTASPISASNLNKAELNEKLEKRKQRFGIEEKSVSSLDEKKRLRAERFKLTNK